MSPAGSGPSSFRPREHEVAAWAVLVVAALVTVLLAFSGGTRAHASPSPAVAALSPAWTVFQTDCEAGPSPGQGNAPSACICWESHLEAAAIYPAYATDAIDAAQVGGGAAYTVGENLSGGPVGQAMAGCGLYAAQST